MENKKGSLSTIFLVIAIILIIVMVTFMYMQKMDADRQIAELENNVRKMQETINNLQDEKTKENLNNEYSIQKIIMWTPDTTSYDFNTKKWLPNDSAEYYVATDKDKKLCIVDRENNLVKKLDIVITDLITSAYVAEWENTLTIIQKDATAYDINIIDFTYGQYQHTDGY